MESEQPFADLEFKAQKRFGCTSCSLTEVALLCAAEEPDLRPKVHDVVTTVDEIGVAGDSDAGAWRVALSFCQAFVCVSVEFC
ncbi:hypothetical protein GUJ93_ZPchr0012g19676 [Zizania palustris]|uniref:Uncharacterized protein n=1 Tax=Zizania palustris TaxID=103762 RepID=A0A8J6BPA3_ZIZPA|nr:hypothetical protein GUJ93_ZPchr0012g19676 [Zizania palustris]